MRAAAPPPDRAQEAAADGLAHVIALLRDAGLNPDRGELADAVWLARWARPAGVLPGEGTDGGPGPYDSADPGAAGRPSPAADARTAAERRDGGRGGTEAGPAPGPKPDGSGRVALSPAPRADGRGEREQPGQRASPGGTDGADGIGGPRHEALPIGVPAATALPALLELQRALRPLQRYRSAAPPVRRELDEAATAEHSARAGGVVMPVFRSVNRADASLQLVMDASSSMCVWDRLLDELHQVFRQLGAFRDVQLHYLHEGPDGEPGLGSRSAPAEGGLRSAEQLADPTGRRVTVFVSDCAGPLWRSGRAHRLLYRLTRHTPVAVLQPLPERLWARTRLPASYGTLLRGEGPGQAARLRFSGGARGVPGAVPVPVLPPVPAALAAWAQLLSGSGGGPVSAAVGWVSPEQPVGPRARRRTEQSPADLVARFRSAASPGAGRLAVHLAAAPLFLPVMQLVQRTMLPDSGPAELSEVLLGGLLTRAEREDGRPGAGQPAEGQWYTFVPGVQEVLLQSLGRGEALLVLKHCSEYVEQRFGKGGPNFPALAIARLTGGQGGDRAAPAGGVATAGSGGPPRAPQPFAEVAAQVLERFMPLSAAVEPESGPGDQLPSAAVRKAQDLVGRFTDHGMVQDLLDAVQMLRRAAEREVPRGADPRLWTELAENLLRLWQLQGGRSLLREARDAAALAAAHPGAVRARAALARVLHATALDRRAAGDRAGALELLRRADREFTAVYAAAGLDSQEALRFTLERARVLEEQWLLGGDSGLLQETVGMLEAFADAWPVDEPQPSGLPLAHGRALLRLGESAADREQVRIHAAQAAVSFRHARTALETEGAAEEELVRAVLDEVDALLLAGPSAGEAAGAAGVVGPAGVATAAGAGEDRGSLERVAGLIAGLDADHLGQELRSAVRTRAGRLRVRRHEAGGRPEELVSAAALFETASRGIPRDQDNYSDLIEEWGDALLRRARLADGGRFANEAVRVLRDCRMETPADDPRLPARLLTLGRALMLRHRDRRDRVDLREAEHLFGLAAQTSEDPLLRARGWLELGGAHRAAYRYTNRPDKLDLAAEAYRKAADAARAAGEREPRTGYTPGTGGAADPYGPVKAAAEAHHWRGVVYEAAGRPRAAREAYRSAAEEWRRLPDGGGEGAEHTATRLAALTT